MTSDPATLTIIRHFDAPPDLVFDAWTNPESRVGWWGPDGFTQAFFERDLRPGGRWRIGMRSASGELMVNGGTYREIVAPTRLVMTHAWENAEGRLGPDTIITITLTARDGGTDMRFEQTGFDTPVSRDGHGQGWGQAFDSLATALDSVEVAR